MSYWEDRIEDYKKWAEKHEDDLMKRLTKIYKNEARKLETQIASYYAKYGENNVIEYRNMMQKLSDDDIALLIEKMDDFALRYPQYAHLMPVRESIYKLNRLEGLQYYVKMQQTEIGAIDHAEMQKYFEQSALKGSNIAMETMGFGKNFYKADSNIIKEFVGLNWANGKNFSTSIWENTTKLAQYLTTDIAQGMARGDSYDKLAKLLRERFEKVSRNDAKRLIFTEGTYIMAESTMQPFKEDFEYYRVSTAQDKKVCPICKEVAKKTFEISERQPGVNFPPLHPWCRCSFEIVVDDWNKWTENYEEKHGDNIRHAEKIKKNLSNNETSDKIRVTEGRNLIGAYKRRSGFDLEIEDLINQQGFDGLPKIIESQDEFYSRVKNDHFIAERTISSDIENEIEKYDEQLLFGDMYVKCTAGGFQYGRGIYCAADYTKGSIPFKQFEHEITQYSWDRPYVKTRWITLDSSAKIIDFDDLQSTYAYEWIKVEYPDKKDAVNKMISLEDKVKKYPRTWNPITQSPPDDFVKLTEDLKSLRNSLSGEVKEGIVQTNRRIKSDGYDWGILAAELGYDAINAKGHGATGSYTVILNRTKMIIFDGGNFNYK